MEPRLPVHIEVAGLLRRVQAEGGFATVLRKGDREAGTLLLVLTCNGAQTRAFERMPQPDGTRAWHCARREDPEQRESFADYLERRGRQDSDLWIVELDIANAERFIGVVDHQS